MSFATQVAELSSADLDKLFDATPTSTPNAEELVIGKQDVSIKQNSFNDIPEFDDSLLQTEEDIEKEPIGDEKEAVDEKEPVDETIDEKEPVDDIVDPIQVNGILKNTVDYLVKQGLWSDFDGRDDLEITQETYADLAAKQAQHSAYEMVNELIDSTGDYGKAIISHIKAGGNPDEIIDLFKEQKEVQQIDTSTEQGKQVKIEKYYKDILGWRTEKVQKHINRVVEDNEIDSEFDEVEELYNKHYQQELDKKQEIVKQQEVKNTERQNTFVSNIKNVLQEDNSLTEKDKKFIASSILEFKHKLDNGQKVNDFYLKFAEMQADPKQYVKLVRYVMDNENYEKQLQQQEKTKASKEIFSFIKGNAAVSKSKATSIEIDDSSTKRTQTKRGTDFSFVIKK